jgi:hypothetical protein
MHLATLQIGRLALTSLKKHNGYPRVQKTHGAMPEQPVDILLKGTLRSQIYLKIRETNLQHKVYFSINYCECANDSPCKGHIFKQIKYCQWLSGTSLDIQLLS